MTTVNRGERGPEPARKKQLLEWLKENATTVVTVPTIGALSEATGIPRRSLEKVLRELKDEGLVDVERPTSRTGPVRLEVV